MSLFRKNALDALSSPEQLDQPLRLLRPGQWLLLLSLGGFSLTVLLWSVLGRLPVRINGRGVLIRPDSLTLVQSENNGRILSLEAEVGDCLQAGAAMARVEPVQQEVEQKQARAQLEQLKQHDLEEDQLGAVRAQQLEAEISRVSGLADLGALPMDDLDRRRQELSSLRDALAARNSQREQQIIQQQTRIRSLEETVRRTANIRAPISGCVIDRSIHSGEVVQPGTTLFAMEAATREEGLESLAFFPAGDGKRLRVGQRVRITPTSTKAQRHGGIEGEVTAIRRLPVQEEALAKRLGLNSLLDAVRSQNQGPLIEVSTSLQRDPRTVSGYDWGGGPGPDLKLSAGTPTEVRVLVEERRPITYVIPILRDLTGIY
jgi:multidrug efflux pump subunit AcrA (membrane-fusion protein)